MEERTYEQWMGGRMERKEGRRVKERGRKKEWRNLCGCATVRTW